MHLDARFYRHLIGLLWLAWGLYWMLRAAGAKAELHVFEGLPHAFDARPDFGRHCANLIALFLDRHVRDPRVITAPATSV